MSVQVPKFQPMITENAPLNNNAKANARRRIQLALGQKSLPPPPPPPPPIKSKLPTTPVKSKPPPPPPPPVKSQSVQPLRPKPQSNKIQQQFYQPQQNPGPTAMRTPQILFLLKKYSFVIASFILTVIGLLLFFCSLSQNIDEQNQRRLKYSGIFFFILGLILVVFICVLRLY